MLECSLFHVNHIIYRKHSLYSSEKQVKSLTSWWYLHVWFRGLKKLKCLRIIEVPQSEDFAMQIFVCVFFFFYFFQAAIKTVDHFLHDTYCVWSCSSWSKIYIKCQFPNFPRHQETNQNSTVEVRSESIDRCKWCMFFFILMRQNQFWYIYLIFNTNHFVLKESIVSASRNHLLFRFFKEF